LKLNEFIDTSRYVYNKTVETIKKGHKVNFQNLRDKLVTENTKKEYKEYKDFEEQIKVLKNENKDALEKNKLNQLIKDKYKELRDTMKIFKPIKNLEIKDFEVNTPKDIRSNAVDRCCDAYKTGFSNLLKGNIKFFNLKFKKKFDPKQTIELTPKNITIKNNIIKILPDSFNDECVLKVKLKSKKIKELIFNKNIDITREKGEYFLHVPLKTKYNETCKKNVVAGIDLGIRTFATVHSNNISDNHTTITEYIHRQDLLKKLNKKLDTLKVKKKIRKKQYNKIEKRKINLVDKLHWNIINDLLLKNDVLYLGDIKSHDIVKKGKNKTLNRAFNDLKFCKFKQRLFYKASLLSKQVILVKEHYTTKCCSNCGIINNNVGSKEVFECQSCNLTTGRDMNASKNMKMKGLLCI
jgi:putative transposase